MFSIRQAAHACNLSHSSLIRLEEKGKLTPAHTDAKTGYRYYDTHNISRSIALVAPYVGREIAPDMYCSQLVLPVKEI